ncbi:hypothetical protein ACWEYW_13215 [Staphylococcus xylosus]
MRKIVIGLVCLFSLALILSGCDKSNKEKLQGTWKADNSDAIESIGEEMTIKGNNIKVKSDEEEPIKYFNFKDKDDDNPKYIRFYTDKSSSKYYNAEYPDREGVLHFKDNDTIEINTSLDGTYIFKRK